MLAVNADESTRGVQQYLAERAFFAPNIVHGHDASFHKQLGFKSNLYNYVLIDPAGKPVSSGFAGSFFPAPEGKKFALPAELAESKTLGHFKIMKPDMSAEIKRLLWPVESGTGHRGVAPEGPAAADARAAAGAGHGRRAVGRWPPGGDQRPVQRLGQRAVAGPRAVGRSGGQLKNDGPGKKARDVMNYLERDEEFKREVAAKRAYDAALEKAGSNAKRRDTGLRNVAKRFEGTHYAQLAEQRLGKPGGEK